MAFSYFVNTRPSTNGNAAYQILTNFVAAGWVVKSSSDGTTYNSSGNQITSGNSGAGGINNNYAWYRIQDPGGGREFVVERSTFDYSYAIKYSLSAQFTGGTPGAVNVPTATDEVKILGNITGGGGAGGTYSKLFATTENSYYMHMVLGDATIQYAFWMVTANYKNVFVNGSLGGWTMDYVTGTDTGDLDPTVHMAFYNSNLFGGALNGGNAYCYFTSITSVNFQVVMLTSWTQAGGGASFGPFAGSPAGSNYWNGYEDVLPAAYTNTAAGTGWKGWSSLFMWTSANNHTFGDVVSIGNPPTFGHKDHICMGYVVAPWPPGVDSIN